MRNDEQDELNMLSKNKSIDKIEKDQLIRARLGQGNFRNELLKLYNGKCMATEINVESMLIASHIKPWAASTNEEKLDKYNGLLLSANIDALFDGGYISFDDDGRVLISSCLKGKNLPDLNFSIDLNNKSKKFMQYHRDKIFKKS